MPITNAPVPAFKPPRETIISWDTFRKGLNLLLRETELGKDEVTTMTNLLLVGSGVPTKRWGTQDFFLSAPSSTGYTTNFLQRIKDSNESQQVLSLTDWGILVKKSGASYTPITGASWPSGTRLEGAQLGDNDYLVSTQRELVRYNFTNLVGFATLAIPTGITLSNISGASGGYIHSWRVTTVSKSGGETIGSTPVSLATLPQDLTNVLINVKWTAVSAASGDLVGYNIYRGDPGSERWVGGVGASVTSFLDSGSISPDPFRTTPDADTTGGPKAKYIIRYQDRLILAGIPGEPTKVLISGRWPYQERFDWYAGGGYILIEPDSGESITGLGIYQEKLIIFKENSVWQLLLKQQEFGDYVILDPQYQLLTASQGCSSHRSIVPVENDLMFSNRRGIYILRYEPQLLTILNANEISAKIKPFFESLSDDDLINSAGAYINKKYLLSFPMAKKTIAFDRERLAFLGPWEHSFGINQWIKYVDENGIERWLAADSDDAFITEFSEGYIDEKGSAIRTIFKTKKENFGDWTLYKTLNEVYMNFRAILGSVSVNIYIEDRSGRTVTAKSFTISGSGSQGSSGFGTDMFGTAQFGLSNNSASAQEDEVTKKAYIYKTTRTFQVEVRTLSNTDNYELLGIKAIAIPQSRGNNPSVWVVS